MTVEMLEGLRNRCIFVPEWECPIETSEIPLEVCKTCLEAQKVRSKHLKITRHIIKAEMMPAQKEALLETEVPQIVSPQSRPNAGVTEYTGLKSCSEAGEPWSVVTRAKPAQQTRNYLR